MFNVGTRRIAKAKAVLARFALTNVAQIAETGILAGLVSLTLDRSDPRYALLLDALRELGHDPFIRVDRHWTRTEIAQASLLRLKVATAGLLGGASLPRQAYNRTLACPTCGAGAEPIPPLVAALSRMGQKLIDRTARDGQLVLHRVLGDALRSEGLGGFDILPASPKGDPKTPSSEFQWVRISSQLPAMVGANLETEDVCPRCARSGHFDSGRDPVQFRYAIRPTDGADINYTYEYFGTWQTIKPTSPVGGHREIVVSQRVREVFERLKVRYVRWDPVVVAPP